jgi:hypothetical protein
LSILNRLVTLLRQATLEYKENLSKRTEEERQSLLEVSEAGAVRQRNLKYLFVLIFFYFCNRNKQELLNTSNKLTDILQRTSNRMVTETHKSTAILEELGILI